MDGWMQSSVQASTSHKKRWVSNGVVHAGLSTPGICRGYCLLGERLGWCGFFFLDWVGLGWIDVLVWISYRVRGMLGLT
jgi:hypothetical protein